MKEGKAHSGGGGGGGGGGGSPPPPPGHRRPRPWWPGIAVTSLLAAWLLLSGRAGQPVGRPELQMRASGTATQAAPLPAALAALGGGGSASEHGSSSDGSGSGGSSITTTTSWPYDSSSELRTEAARQVVPELQQSAARAALYFRWAFNPAALNATGAPMAQGLRIPRILHHGARDWLGGVLLAAVQVPILCQLRVPAARGGTAAGSLTCYAAAAWY